jgi:hypothetical protein
VTDWVFGFVKHDFSLLDDLGRRRIGNVLYAGAKKLARAAKCLINSLTPGGARWEK